MKESREMTRYPKMDELGKLADAIKLQVQLKTEYGATGTVRPLKAAEQALRVALRDVKGLPIDRKLAKLEPNGLKAIQSLRAPGPRRMWPTFKASAYSERLAGAFLGRMAGCTLGAPVEFWPVDKMRALAEENGDRFPPTDYWSYVPEPAAKRYEMSPRRDYTRGGMNGVPVDDDTIYTILGLLIAEDHGPKFSTKDVGKAWVKYLPYACTAEDIALKNLKKGVSALQAGSKDNPFCEWIGADIRADPFGYMAPGWPERAAAMAYQDAYLSHRRQGIYGEMFFAAAIAAAFAVDDPVKALKIGLTEIPRGCALRKAVQWALRIAPRIKNYKQARSAMNKKFKGMHDVHTINNACLTVWAITIGKKDFTRVIGEAVAMGMDNDCTAATAGSIVGAVIGRKGIPSKWYKPFGDTIRSYLIKKKQFSIKDVLKRFEKQARRVHSTKTP
jgi:ADP-ribosylglycohydrolase